MTKRLVFASGNNSRFLVADVKNLPNSALLTYIRFLYMNRKQNLESLFLTIVNLVNDLRYVFFIKDSFTILYNLRYVISRHLNKAIIRIRVQHVGQEYNFESMNSAILLADNEKRREKGVLLLERIFSN